MKLPKSKQVYCEAINFALRRNPLTKDSNSVATVTEMANPETNDWRKFQRNNRVNTNAPLVTKASVKMSLTKAILSPTPVIDFELNTLENNYQPEQVKSKQVGIKLKILVVEERDEIRNRVSSILRRENFQVIEAKDSDTALKLAQSQLPDLVICELIMPIIHGYDIAHLLKESAITAQIPFLFITTFFAENNADSRIILITDAATIKPLTTETLLTAIKQRIDVAIVQDSLIAIDFDNW